MKLTIDVSKIEELLNSLKKTIDDYEAVDSIFFSTLKESSSFWHDNISIDFFLEVESERFANKRAVSLLKNKYNILLYIKNNYITIGKKIRCDLSYKETIINYLNKIINKISYCLNIYNSMNYSFCTGYEKERIYYEKNKLLEVYNDILLVKKRVTDTYKKIEEIEGEVGRRLSKIDGIIIRDFPINKFTGDN